MIKLFSLNHTRTRKFLILAQDKTQFRRVTVLIFRVRNTSASAHTNYLVNFLKSVWAVAQSRPRILHRSAALSTTFFEEFLKQIFEHFQVVASLVNRRCLPCPSEVVRILQPSGKLSTPIFNFFTGLRFPPIELFRIQPERLKITRIFTPHHGFRDQAFRIRPL